MTTKQEQFCMIWYCIPLWKRMKARLAATREADRDALDAYYAWCKSKGIDPDSDDAQQGYSEAVYCNWM
jgi:hypothetical protein